MEKELLKVINDELLKLGINYEYGTYTGELKYPYAVGEYNEKDYQYENDITNGDFILVVFHKGNELDLINIKEQVKDILPSFGVAVAMAVPVFASSFISMSPYIMLPLQIVVGAVITITICEVSKLPEYLEIKGIVVPLLNKVIKQK